MRCEIWAQPAELPWHIYMYMYMYMSAGRALYPECRVSWVRIPSEVIFHYKKSDCLGCAVLLSLFV